VESLFDLDPPLPADGPGASVRLRMLVAYHGGGFHGIALQSRHRTVGGVLTEAATTVLQLSQAPKLVVAGRTDAGVHGWGQVLHLDVQLRKKLDLVKLKRSLNQMLAPEVVVRAVEVAPEGFHARYSARYRRYRYEVVNRPDLDPFRVGLAWHVTAPLDLRLMTLACDPLFGTHDFSSFCRVPKGDPDASMIRTLTDARWLDLGDGLLRFEIGASSFCQQMVRAVVGVMVEVGTGKRTAGDVMQLLRSRDRSTGSPLAPAAGLYLWEVGYPDGFGGEAGSSRDR
jgi:tRNA pseudouridine38-40 synthase